MRRTASDIIRSLESRVARLEGKNAGLIKPPKHLVDKITEILTAAFANLWVENKDIINSFGVWGLKKFMGKEYDGILRSTFIIGKDGKLKAIMDKVKTKSHHDDVIDWINANL